MNPRHPWLQTLVAALLWGLWGLYLAIRWPWDVLRRFVAAAPWRKWAALALGVLLVAALGWTLNLVYERFRMREALVQAATWSEGKSQEDVRAEACLGLLREGFPEIQGHPGALQVEFSTDPSGYPLCAVALDLPRRHGFGRLSFTLHHRFRVQVLAMTKPKPRKLEDLVQ